MHVDNAVKKIKLNYTKLTRIFQKLDLHAFKLTRTFR